jgi:hypothetical protein
LPHLCSAWAAFWEWAIDDAHGKIQVGEAKRVKRQMGRVLRQCARDGWDSSGFLAACRRIDDELAQLRHAGRPSKAAFHDLVAFAYALRCLAARDDRAQRLELLRRFLELPELGFALQPRDISHIGCRVIRKLAAGRAHDTYLRTAAFFADLDAQIDSSARASVGRVLRTN